MKVEATQLLGALIHPPHRIWEGTRIEFLQATEDDLRTLALSEVLGGAAFHVFRDGFVAFESENAEGVVIASNAFFFALSYLTRILAHPMTEAQLERANLIGETHFMSSRTYTHLRNAIADDDDRGKEARLREKWDEMGGLFLDTEEVRVIIGLANHIMAKARPRDVLKHLETMEQFSQGNWIGCCLLGWITVEQAIDEELVRHYLTEEMSPAQAHSKVRKKFEKEVLKELLAREPLQIEPPDPTVFTHELLEEFDALRDKRNEIAHEGRTSSRNEATAFQNASEKAMWRIMRHQSVNYRGYRDTIDPLSTRRHERLGPGGP